MTTQQPELRQEIVERVYRPWGWYETLTEQPGYKVKRIEVAPGHQLSLQKHAQRAEHWTVVRGMGAATLGQAEVILHVGQHCDIAIGQVHRLRNPSSTEVVQIIELQFGDYLGEDDIERLQDDYGRL
jgi:mannose-6-phosphate isomerase